MTAEIEASSDDFNVPTPHTCLHHSAMRTLSTRYLLGLPDKKALNGAFVGKPVAILRTPALVIDKATFAANCARMHQNVTSWGADFRAHIKTHKVRPLVGCVRPDYLTFVSLEDRGGYKTPVDLRRGPDALYCRLDTDGGVESRRWRSGVRWDC